MTKKFTIEYVKDYVEEQNYKLISTTYNNSKEKIDLECDKGHSYKATFDKFKSGCRCPECGHINQCNILKHSFDYVKNYIESFNYKLLSEEYINCNEKIMVQCDQGHEYQIKFSNFKSGSRCPECALIKNKLTWRHSFDHVKEYFSSLGFTLLSSTYTNSNSPLTIKCSNDHVFEKPFNYIKRNPKCPICHPKKEITIDFIIENLKVEGYSLLKESYETPYKKFKVQCDKGHVYETVWHYFAGGYRCPHCWEDRRADSCRLDYDHVKNEIEKTGYTLLSSTYKNAKSKLRLKCNNGHVYKANWNNFFHNGERCPNCNIVSKPEKEIQKFVETFNLVQINNDRKTILNPLTNCNLELDIFLPELKKAIEFNGDYFHAAEHVKKRDRIKKFECDRLNIDLMVIQEKDFTKDKQSVFDKIKEFING